MTYSRRQLYALGEPLGDSVTRKVAGKTIYGGGGGGPSSQTITQSNIPDWLRPQVETVLGGAMEEMFNTSETEDGTLKITGVKPYKPYSTNPADAVAGFSPMQQQAFQGAANLQNPWQFGQASDMAMQAGLGGLGTAGQAAGYGMQAAGLANPALAYGRQSARAGGDYMRSASDADAMSALMSPYMQNVVDVQQQAAQRQADINLQAQKAKFAQSGGMGGGRDVIATAQSNADLMRQKLGIQAQGQQAAFDQARQAQQFGANLGLQGLAQGLQGVNTAGQMYGLGLQGAQTALGGYGLLGQQANTLGSLGAQDLASQQSIIGLQNQLGGTQQQQQQNIINQAIHDYSMAQQNPFNTFAMYNSLLRGYAIPGQTATTYQAAPSLASQVGGLGMGAYGISQLMGKAEGGKIEEKKMATGGIASINKKVLLDPESVTAEQIKAGIKNQTISDLIGLPVLAQKQQEAQQMQAAMAAKQGPQPSIMEQLMQAAPQMAPQGVDALPTSLPQQMAGGGIVAFAKGDVVDDGEDDDDTPAPRQAGGFYTVEGDPESYKYAIGMLRERLKNPKSYGVPALTPEQEQGQVLAAMKNLKAQAGSPYYDEYRKKLESQLGESEGELRQARGLAALAAMAPMMSARTLGEGLGGAGEKVATHYGAALKADAEKRRQIQAMQMNLADAERKENMGFASEARQSVVAAQKNKVAAADLQRKADRDTDRAAGELAKLSQPKKAPPKGAGAGPKSEAVSVDAMTDYLISQGVEPKKARYAAIMQYKAAGAGVAAQTRTAADAEKALKDFKILSMESWAKLVKDHGGDEKAASDAFKRDYMLTGVATPFQYTTPTNPNAPAASASAASAPSGTTANPIKLKPIKP